MVQSHKEDSDEYAADEIRDLIMEADTTVDVETILRSYGIRYEKDMECGYFNIRIKRPDGMIRIYQDFRKSIVVQAWTKCNFRYSGIPTFEPSGKHSF